MSGYQIEFSKNKKTATYTGTNSSWNSTALGKKSSKYSLKLGQSCYYLMVNC
jgi:hypothetical protein